MRKILFSTAFLLLSLEHIFIWRLIPVFYETKPFVYRALIPLFVEWAGDWSIYFIEAVFCVLLGLAMLYLYEMYAKVSIKNDVRLLLAFYLVVFLADSIRLFAKVYDIPAAFFFVLLVILQVKKKYALSIPVFILASLNRETTIALIPFMLLVRPDKSVLAHVASWVSIKVMMLYVFNGFDAYKASFLDNIASHLSIMGVALFVLFAAVFIAYVLRARYIPFAMNAFIVTCIPIFFVAYFVLGYPFEIRIFVEIAPVLFMALILK